MGRIALVVGVLIFLLTIGVYALVNQQTNAYHFTQTDDPILGVYEGMTPCGEANRPLPQIPANSDCDQMIWKLTLYHDADTGSPTTYQLMSSYGLSQQGTTGLQGGGTAINLEGKWDIIRGTKTDPDAVVYQLHADGTESVIRFVRIDDNLIHVLAPDSTMMVGNGAWSFTLNRTDPAPTANAPDATSELANTPLPDTLVDAAMSGQFDGRSPCAEIILELQDIPTTAGCQRVKWRLILHLDDETHLPTTYELYNLYVATGDTRYEDTGGWSIVQGTPADPEAIVYQLHSARLPQPLSFLKVDDNHLFLLTPDFHFMVGDAFASYTLSRSG